MPLRTDSHKIGDLAETQVAELFEQLGLAVDPVISDYGEDLVVQSVSGEPEAFARFFVQVKGTRHLARFEHGGFYKVRGIRLSTVTKWLSGHEVIILVLWDITRKLGAYGFVHELFDDTIEVLQNVPKSVSAFLPKSNNLESSTAWIVSQRAISRWATVRCSLALAAQALAERGIVEEAVAAWQIHQAAQSYLLNMDIISFNLDGKGGRLIKLNPQFMEAVGRRVAKAISEKWERSVKDKNSIAKLVETAVAESIILEIVEWVYARTGDGVEHTCVEVSAHFLLAYMQGLVKDLTQDLGVQSDFISSL